jgi:6-phospho-beta-glucosidase
MRDLKRYKKKSFDWFKKVISTNGQDLEYKESVSLK